MRKRHIIFISIVSIIVLLVYSHWSSQENDFEPNDVEEMSFENLFIPIKADTLIAYLNEFKMNHPSLEITNYSSEIVIKYNKHALILLNATANDMSKEREEFVRSGIIKDDNDKTVITLEKEKKDGHSFVSCPAPMLAEILRVKELKQIEKK